MAPVTNSDLFLHARPPRCNVYSVGIIRSLCWSVILHCTVGVADVRKGGNSWMWTKADNGERGHFLSHFFADVLYG